MKAKKQIDSDREHAARLPRRVICGVHLASIANRDLKCFRLAGEE